MDKSQEDFIKTQIENLMLAVGATGEFLGYMRESLMKNGFSREEAVGMCNIALAKLLTPRDNIG